MDEMPDEIDIRGGVRGKYFDRYWASRQKCYGLVHFWNQDEPLCECGRWAKRGTWRRRWQEIREYLTALYR